MCLILKKEIWGTLPSCLSKSNVQVLADFAPRGMRVRSSVRSPVEHNMTVCKVPWLWSNWLETSRHFLTNKILDARPSQLRLRREHFPALKTGHTLLKRFLIGSWHDYVSNDQYNKKVLYTFTNWEWLTFFRNLLTNEIVSWEGVRIPYLQMQSGRNFLLWFVPREETGLKDNTQ